MYLQTNALWAQCGHTTTVRASETARKQATTSDPSLCSSETSSEVEFPASGARKEPGNGSSDKARKWKLGKS